MYYIFPKSSKKRDGHPPNKYNNHPEYKKKSAKHFKTLVQRRSKFENVPNRTHTGIKSHFVKPVPGRRAQQIVKIVLKSVDN